MSPTAQPYPDIAQEVAHSPAPDGRMEEANSDVRQPGRMKSDTAYLRMRDAFIRWHALGCFGAAAEYQAARQAWELTLMEQGNT